MMNVFTFLGVICIPYLVTFLPWSPLYRTRENPCRVTVKWTLNETRPTTITALGIWSTYHCLESLVYQTKTSVNSNGYRFSSSLLFNFYSRKSCSIRCWVFPTMCVCLIIWSFDLLFAIRCCFSYVKKRFYNSWKFLDVYHTSLYQNLWHHGIKEVHFRVTVIKKKVGTTREII